MMDPKDCSNIKIIDFGLAEKIPLPDKEGKP